MSDKTKNIIAWILSIILAFAFVAAGIAKLAGDEMQVANFERWGYPDWSIYPVAIIEILMAISLLIPRYRILGTTLVFIWAIGAIATHLQVSPPEYPPIGTDLAFVVIAIFIRRLSKERAKD